MTFDCRVVQSDGHGNEEGDFAERFTVWGRVRPLKGGERGGGETVMADRLAGVQPVIIRVRYSSETRQITPGWRARGSDGTVYDIATAANVDERREYIDILARFGVAA